jgi:hypothetical protein
MKNLAKNPLLKAILSHLKDAFSDRGKGSFGRMAAAVVIASTLFWVSYVVFLTHAIPDLAGPTLFLTGGVGATYVPTKVAAAMKDDPETPDTSK